MKSTCNYRTRPTLKCRRLCCRKPILRASLSGSEGTPLIPNIIQSKLTYHKESPLEQLNSWRNRQNDTHKD